MYKGILDGKAHAVFNGRIIVRKDAQKTDSKQTNKNLVLSDEAVINTKPELQIYADDVQCTHGATIGQLDSEALFYLQSRGIAQTVPRATSSPTPSRRTSSIASKCNPCGNRLERFLFEKFMSMRQVAPVSAGFDVETIRAGLPRPQAVHPRQAPRLSR